MSEIPGLDTEAVRWSADAAARGDRPLLVLLHGYGSEEGDLMGLVPHLPDDFVFAAVRAPLTPPFPAPGWSWFPIEGVDGRDPAATTAAAEALLAWLDALPSQHPSVGLLGFSQGGVVALQAMRLQPERFAFVVNLAGYADPHPLPGDDVLAESKPPVFWGRGALDQVIPPERVEHTVQWLPAHSDLRGRVYPALGHSVSQDELDDVVAFLRTHLEA